MSKPLLGIILGAVIGFLDGLTALFTPEADQIWNIAPWSSLKGIIVGLIIGLYARKVNSISKAVVFGLMPRYFLHF
ncbi:hypothetical protein IH970_10075 [candidate division KSB1 bacterium]|nr:hypothetical protein [candidate division KSB1 bacterium]